MHCKYYYYKNRKIQLFSGYMEGKDYGDLKMAKFYLEDNDYNIEKAKTNYLEDVEFESKNEKKFIEMQG